MIIIWKGYFSVNPILSFCSFESKKSVVVNVVMAAKYLSISSKRDLSNEQCLYEEFLSTKYHWSITRAVANYDYYLLKFKKMRQYVYKGHL